MDRKSEDRLVEQAKLASLEQDNEVLRLRYCTLEQRANLSKSLKLDGSFDMEGLTMTPSDSKSESLNATKLYGPSSTDVERSKGQLHGKIESTEDPIRQDRTKKSADEMRIRELEKQNEILWQTNRDVQRELMKLQDEMAALSKNPLASDEVAQLDVESLEIESPKRPSKDEEPSDSPSIRVEDVQLSQYLMELNAEFVQLQKSPPGDLVKQLEEHLLKTYRYLSRARGDPPSQFVHT
eukprot:TRINITY_DN6522_c0_g1_i1.p1 TRINITY_DN6522_c0_g1~~TRINITY_DN6522_c0_g1_i1.p1  ORF type:complete len:267 (-),score=67.54 TRINITY_DN6522_c0_g1_i1:14-727(-)